VRGKEEEEEEEDGHRLERTEVETASFVLKTKRLIA
jgi:hypothetical protein